LPRRQREGKGHALQLLETVAIWLLQREGKGHALQLLETVAIWLLCISRCVVGARSYGPDEWAAREPMLGFAMPVLSAFPRTAPAPSYETSID
jgi:hypothetical protein